MMQQAGRQAGRQRKQQNIYLPVGTRVFSNAAIHGTVPDYPTAGNANHYVHPNYDYLNYKLNNI
jgi:hypothetical protein